MARARPGRLASFTWVVLAYAAAGAVAAIVAALAGPRSPWVVVALADAAATVAVFAFSRALDNSSVYDPYWSVAPMVIAPALALGAGGEAPALRRLIVVGLVLVWGARLTLNWARGWGGLGHEDWRYVDLRHRTGGAYWAVSLLGLHLMPTLSVYLGCLALLPALGAAGPLGPLDAVAGCVTAGAIAIEAAADEQLRAFRRGPRAPGEILASGLWSRCRHPNYLGEIGFWWGLSLFALAADRGAWWTLAGPLWITGLFVLVSVPLIDRRSLARRPGYALHMSRVPALLPRLFAPARRRPS